MNATAVFASRSKRASVSRTLMVSFVKAMGNDQFANRFNIPALKYKECQEGLHDADTSPAREMVCTRRPIKWAVECKAKTILPNS